MNLSLERVLRFVTVAEQLSFTRAAEILRIDQPWLSRQVMQLEGQLGFSLFDRSGSRIALTPEGLEFFNSARQVAEAAQRVKEKADEMRRRTHSVLRIGLGYATLPFEASQTLLREYAQMRPTVSLETSAYEWSDDALAKLAAGELDFCIVIGPVTDPNLEACVLHEVKASLAIPKEDPLANETSVRLSDLAGRRVAVGLRNTTTARYEKAFSWIEEVGATAVYVLGGRRFIFDHAEADRLFVMRYSPTERVPPSFVCVPIRGERPDLTLNLVRCRRPLPPTGEKMWSFAQEMAQRISAD